MRFKNDKSDLDLVLRVMGILVVLFISNFLQSAKISIFDLVLSSSDKNFLQFFPICAVDIYKLD